MAMENNEAPLYKADDRYQGYLDQEQVRLAEAARTGKLNEYYGFVGDFDTLKTNNLGDRELRDCFYASSDNEAPLFHIESYKDRYVNYFYSQSNEFQDQERTRLTQKFVNNIAEGKKPYDGLTRNDLILFFDQQSKGKLNFGQSFETDKAMVEMLSMLPEAQDRSSWKILQRINRARKRRSLEKAAIKLAKINHKQENEHLKLTDKYLTGLGAPRLYEMTNQDLRDTIAHCVESNFRLAKLWYEGTYFVTQKLGLNRETINLRIQRHQEAAIARKWYNPKKYYAKAAAGFYKWRKNAQEQKSIYAMPVEQIKIRKEQLEAKIADLSAQIENGGSATRIKYISSDLKSIKRLLTEADKAIAKKIKKYNAKIDGVNKKYSPEIQNVESKIVSRYNAINNETDALDNSTTTGKWLAGILEHASASKRKELEAVVRERKKQDFRNQEEYAIYIKRQLRAGGFNKSPELMRIISDTIAKDTGNNMLPNAPRDGAREQEESLQGNQKEIDLQQTSSGQVHTPDNLQELETQQQHEAEEQAKHQLEENTAKQESVETEIAENKDQEKADTPILHDTPAPEHSERCQSYTNLETIFSNLGYKKVEASAQDTPEAEQHSHADSTFRNSDDGHMVTVEKTDNSNYYVTAKDKDGKEDKAQVDDLVAVMKEMSQNGNKVIELGTVQSPEFLARAEIAAEKAGVTISNLAEKKKEMEERGLKDKVKEEKAIETTRSALGGVNIDVSTQEGLDHAVSKMEALVFIKDLPTKEYEEFKNDPDFKKLNLNDKEMKLFDNVNKLKNKGEFASQPEEKQARILGRMINSYVSSYANAKDNAKGDARKKQKAGREAAANFVKTNATRLGISNGGR